MDTQQFINMNKKLFYIGIVVVLTLLFFFSNLAKDKSIVENEEKIEIQSVEIDPIILQINEMSLDEKIGQLLIVGFSGYFLDEHIQKMILDYHISGVNLLGRNVKDETQVKKLILGLQAISSIPLFISTDQEGEINRFKFLKELTPQIEIIDNTQAEEVAFKRALELKNLGINMNFSPVVDYVSKNNSYLYKRTFGQSPKETGSFANSMINGYTRAGIIAVPKHFPGYGNVVLDPHNNQSILPITIEEFEINLIPFKEVLLNKNTLAMMTAHIVIPEVDPNPATLSYKFITEILRNKLNFNGVIITDDIEMISAGDSIPLEQIVVNSILSGSDIVIASFTPEKTISIFNRLKEAVINNEISEERIDESLIRILNLKSLITSTN